MIERQFIDLFAGASKGARITHLTDAADSQWSGIVRLPMGERLALLGTSHHDAFVLQGSVRDGEGTRIATGDFIAGCQSSVLVAAEEDAVLFAYHEVSSLEGTSRRVPFGAREWHSVRAPLMDAALLLDGGHRVSLVRWRPGAQIKPHAHPYGEEIFVLEGELRSARERYPAGTWLRLHPNSPHAPFADTPTLILLRNGHLRTGRGQFAARTSYRSTNAGLVERYDGVSAWA